MENAKIGQVVKNWTKNNNFDSGENLEENDNLDRNGNLDSGEKLDGKCIFFTVAKNLMENDKFGQWRKI